MNLHGVMNLREYSSCMRGFVWNLGEFAGAAADLMSKIFQNSILFNMK